MSFNNDESQETKEYKKEMRMAELIKQDSDKEKMAKAHIISVLRNYDITAFGAIRILKEVRTTYLKRCIHITKFLDK